jgi:beta-galactosidase
MTTITTAEAVPTAVARHTPWARPETFPAMSNEPGSAARVTISSRCLRRGGRPFIAVSGEMHYSRVPRSRWLDRLRLMQAGGLTAVSSYIPWIHHEEVRGRFDFTDDRDLRAWVEQAAGLGLDVVLRIGPWIHGEVRNGGFPDWVQAAEVRHRTDDPAYLALVEPWFQRLGAELDGLLGDSGPVIAIQVENELYDQPDHIATLKRLAHGHGLTAPIWAATGWGEAQLPGEEVLPLWGGYPDGFWAHPDSGWREPFREQFFFTHLWDDPNIGADVRWALGGPQATSGRRSPSEAFPPATCELGGGMIGAYHRRPLVGGADVAAIGLAKIGSGSAWQGFYMYTGGVNPYGLTGMQESQESGYPNDMPTFDYDFNAPISATGRIRPSHALLRRQHAFLAAFGEALALMPSTFPAEKPADLGDRTTLRWALRSDGRRGFVFVNAHQPYEPLSPRRTGVAVELDEETIEFPALTVPRGTLAHWPVNLDIAGVTIRWATASPLTLLTEGTRPTLVLIAEEGIPVQLEFAGSPQLEAPNERARVDGHRLAIDASTSCTVGVTVGESSFHLLVLSPADGSRAWVFESPVRRLVLADEAVWIQQDGSLAGRDRAGSARVQHYDVTECRLVNVGVDVDNPAVDSVLPTTLLRSAAEVGVDAYGAHDRRYSAPRAEDRARLSARIRVTLPPDIDDRDAELEVTWEGDVLQLAVDGVVVRDQFWTGQEFVANLRDAGVTAGSEVVLEVLPLHPLSNIFVSPGAQRLRDASSSPLGRVRQARLVEPARWHESL